MNDQLADILYVEDEPDIQAIAKIALENIGGFNVHFASSGAEALRKLENFTPQLILMDVMMPVLDGISTLNKLKEEHNNVIPVVFMTAKAQPQEIQGYLDLGAIEVIVKPFDPLRLPDTVRQIWGNYKSLH